QDVHRDAIVRRRDGHDAFQAQLVEGELQGGRRRLEGVSAATRARQHRKADLDIRMRVPAQQPTQAHRHAGVLEFHRIQPETEAVIARGRTFLDVAARALQIVDPAIAHVGTELRIGQQFQDERGVRVLQPSQAQARRFDDAHLRAAAAYRPAVWAALYLARITNIEGLLRNIAAVPIPGKVRMITLYHRPKTRSSRFLFLLEELGAPYRIQIVTTRNRDGTGAPDPANPHPHGKVPAISDDGV